MTHNLAAVPDAPAQVSRWQAVIAARRTPPRYVAKLALPA